METKYTVIKNDDIEQYMNDREKLILQELLYSMNQRKKKEGKETNNQYLVINTDEQYAPQVIEILKANDHWDEGSDQEFLLDEDCVKIEFKGTSYTFTKEDRDVSESFNKPAGTVKLTHRIDGFYVPLYLLVDVENSEFTFAVEEGENKFSILQDEIVHAQAVALVVFANENHFQEQLPSEEEKPEIQPAEQPEETPKNAVISSGVIKLTDLEEPPSNTQQPFSIPEYDPSILRKGQLLLHKKGNAYKVKELDLHHSEKPDEALIKYKALYKTDKKIWVRPKWMFSKDRFQPLSFWEYLQLKLGNDKTKEKLLTKKFGQ